MTAKNKYEKKEKKKEKELQVSCSRAQKNSFQYYFFKTRKNHIQCGVRLLLFK